MVPDLKTNRIRMWKGKASQHKPAYRGHVIPFMVGQLMETSLCGKDVLYSKCIIRPG